MALQERIPPGPPGVPLLGAVVSYMNNPLDFMMDNYRKYGEVVRIDLLGIKGAALHGADANRMVLVDNASNFLISPLIDKVRARWIVGNGLLFIDDPDHKQQRKLMMPAFHRRRIESYADLMRAATHQMLDGWVAGEPLDISRQMHRLALIIAGRALFNMDLAGAAHELGDAVASLVKVISNPLNIGLAQLPFDIGSVGEGATIRRALKRIDTILTRIIEEHAETHSDTGDIVSMLVAARDEAGDRLTTAQIRDQLLTLFVASHETSANALSWAFYLLAQHPDVTRKLLAELDRELHGADPTPADLERLPYLEQVTKETLRLYPPAPSANRIVKETFEWKGYTLKKGELVSYVPYVSHRMPNQFPEPEIFMPERFDPSYRPQPPQYAYIPFAAGPRSCIGAPFAMMEIRLVLAIVLQRFRLDLVPGQYIEATVRTTVQPKDGILMRPHPQDGRVEFSPARVTGNVVKAIPV